MKQTIEEYTEEVFDYFSANFMEGDPDQHNAKFENHPIVKEVIKDGYDKGINPSDLDDALHCAWHKLSAKGELR